MKIHRYIQYKVAAKGFARRCQGGTYMLRVNVNEMHTETRNITQNHDSGSKSISAGRPIQTVINKKNREKYGQSQEDAKEQGAYLSISPEGVGLLANRENKSAAEATEKQIYQEQLESGNEEADAFEDMAKIMEIARRISMGDKVPSKDEKKLMEFNPKLYQAAKAAAMLHAGEKQRKHKSLFEEEEENEMDSKLRDLERENTGNVEKCAGTTDGGDLAEAGSDTVALTG